MIFTLICCENKRSDSTRLKELALKFFNYALVHGGCHSIKPMRYIISEVHSIWLTWIECDLVVLVPTIPLLLEHSLPYPRDQQQPREQWWLSAEHPGTEDVLDLSESPALHDWTPPLSSIDRTHS